jgi:hypothetical protein
VIVLTESIRDFAVMMTVLGVELEVKEAFSVKVMVTGILKPRYEPCPPPMVVVVTR